MGAGFNPLAGGGGWGMSQQMGRGGYGYGGYGYGGYGYPGGSMVAQSPMQRGGAAVGGNRRTKVRQRGREGYGAPAGGYGGGGYADYGGYNKIRIKISGMRTLAREAPRKRQPNKRQADIHPSAAQAKRAKKAAAQPEELEEDPTNPIYRVKQAGDRPFEANPGEANPFEVGALVEVDAKGDGNWQLATVTKSVANHSFGFHGDKVRRAYTVQLEAPPAAADDGPTGTGRIGATARHKPQLPSDQVRVCCAHEDCRTHWQPWAALPLFCDRCRKSLLQQSSQAVYLQEKSAPPPYEVPLRMCSTCFNHLRVTRQRDRAAFKSDVQKFTHECTHAGGVRLDLNLQNFLEHRPVARDEKSDLPLMSNEDPGKWCQCAKCHTWYHWVCALYDDSQYKKGRPFYCKKCVGHEPETEVVKELREHNDASTLQQTPMGAFLEAEVMADLGAASVTCEPITVRVVSNLLQTSHTPERLVAHCSAISQPYPREFPYQSKCILVFQKRDGLDVCLFALYVQEYGSDCPEPNKNRVYISYLDSVRYFKSTPAGHRSTVYHSVLAGYLGWVRKLGFKHVHIWVEPPKAGDEYIFFARGDQQRKPMKREKLREWYTAMLTKAKEKGHVAQVGSMSEIFGTIKSIAEIPLFHGDQWEITVPSLLGIDDEKDYDVRTKDKSKLLRMDAKGVIDKALGEMKHLKKHFLVVVLSEPDGEPAKDEDPVISTDLTDDRQSFLGQCQACHWQFNTLRHAQHATRMILNHIHNKPSYCIEECKRGRVEDGSFMVGCDNCDNWYHGECVGVSKEDANSLENYLCPNCIGGGPKRQVGAPPPHPGPGPRAPPPAPPSPTPAASPAALGAPAPPSAPPPSRRSRGAAAAPAAAAEATAAASAGPSVDHPHQTRHSRSSLQAVRTSSQGALAGSSSSAICPPGAAAAPPRRRRYCPPRAAAAAAPPRRPRRPHRPRRPSCPPRAVERRRGRQQRWERRRGTRGGERRGRRGRRRRRRCERRRPGRRRRCRGCGDGGGAGGRGARGGRTYGGGARGGGGGACGGAGRGRGACGGAGRGACGGGCAVTLWISGA